MVEGAEVIRANKYGAERAGKYASKKEAAEAAKLAALSAAGKIRDLREQVPFILVEGQGKIRAIRYIADFTYLDDRGFHICDAKGYAKNPVYRLKKKLLLLLHGLTIEEM